MWQNDVAYFYIKHKLTIPAVAWVMEKVIFAIK